MNIFTNTLLTVQFISKALATNREKGTYHLYVQKTAAEEIKKSYELNDGSITRIHYLKIQWYMATTLYLGEVLSELRPEKLIETEKKSLIWLGALIAITDLIVDEFNMDSDKLTRLMTNEAERSRSDLSAIEQVLLLYYRRLLTVISKEKAETIHDFSLLKPQIDSQAQLSTGLTKETVMEHTRKKGGTALLLIASLLFDLTEKNKAAFYQLGTFIQLMNDSQDLPKDIRNGITTFISFQKSYKDIQKLLEEEFRKTAVLFHGSGFPEAGVFRLLFYFHAMLTGINYKLRSYSRITHNVMDADKFRNTDKSKFSVHMFSPESIIYCLPRVFKFTINLYKERAPHS